MKTKYGPLLGVAAFALCLGDTGAWAQQEGRGDPYAPRGARIGGFKLFPKLNIEESYNDNIFAAETDEIDDFITKVSPGVDLRSQFKNHALNLSASGDIVRYLDSPDENYEDQTYSASGRLDIRRRTRFNLGADYKVRHEDRGSPDDVLGKEPTKYSVKSANARFRHDPGRLKLELSGDINDSDFDDVEKADGTAVNNDDRDRVVYKPTIRLGYELQPEYQAFVKGTYDVRSYDVEAAEDDNGEDRDSDGYRVDVGTALRFSGLLRGDVFVGYMEQDYEDPNLRDIDGLSYGVDLTWNVTKLTTVKPAVARSIEETTSANSSGFLQTRIGLTVDHELLRTLTLTANASYTESDYQGIDRTDEVIAAGVKGAYIVNRNLRVRASYDYKDKDSTQAGSSYTQNTVKLSVQLQF